MNIQDTPEFHISTGEMRMKASSTRELFNYPIQNAVKMGLKISDQTVMVKCNDGIEHEVPVVASFNTVAISNLKRVSIEKDNRKVLGYMLKGSSPKVKSAIYFAASDFDNSEGLKQLNKTILDMHLEYKSGIVKQIQEELRSNLPDIAKDAMDQLPKIIKNAADKNQAAFDWFKDNGFIMLGVTVQSFTPFVKHSLETGYVVSSFTTSAVDDKWGHTKGVSVEIDFSTKKISTSIWSSDD
jgi:hypothetical protein